jgi:hypothetical protein
MAVSRLAVRSAKARDLARRLARRENHSIAERALEYYEICQVGHEPAMSFYARLPPQSGTDLDLEAVVDGSHEIHKGKDV